MTTFIKRHFRRLEALLLEQSNLCQPEFPSYDIGLNREFFVREILRSHLPPYCGITSGFLCDKNQEPSGQVDIILFHPLSLRINIGATDCCLSESTFAAIEIKSRLNEDNFKKSAHNLAKIRGLSRAYLYTPLIGATASSEAYHYNTIGTVLFGYSGYSTAEKCVEILFSLLKESWDNRPEVIYSLNPTYILVRDDYLELKGDGIIQETGSSWIERISTKKIKGYCLINENSLLILLTILTKRIQCNYFIFPSIFNYIIATE